MVYGFIRVGFDAEYLETKDRDKCLKFPRPPEFNSCGRGEKCTAETAVIFIEPLSDFSACIPRRASR